MNAKLFISGLVLGLAFFLGANIQSYQEALPCCDGFAPFGFPFTLGHFGGYVGSYSYYLPGLFADVLVAFIVSGAFAFVFGKLVPVVQTSFRRVIAWHLSTRL